jgi:excisionase family DNA binding protein
MNTPAADDHPDLLDFKQVAKRLNTSVRSVRTLVSLGELTVIRSPLRTVRFHPDDVAEYIEKWRSKPVDLKRGRCKPPQIAPAAPTASTDATDDSKSAREAS